jgi:NAD(P)-dependent dehydrogenase (short-subunit alcohol dehydrogenase family)
MRHVIFDQLTPFPCAIGEVKYYKCDVTDPAAIAEVAKKVRAEVSTP